MISTFHKASGIALVAGDCQSEQSEMTKGFGILGLHLLTVSRVMYNTRSLKTHQLIATSSDVPTCVIVLGFQTHSSPSVVLKTWY